MESLPVISIAPLLEDPAYPPTAAAVAAACEQHGFFLVSDHGVAEDVLERIDKLTREFFHLPYAEKVGLGGKTPVGYLGYRALGGISTAASLGHDTPPDLVETFGIKNVDTATPYAEHNFWPAIPVDFRAAWSDYWAEMEVMQGRILRVFEAALGLPAGWFADKFTEAASTLKANFYPAQELAPLPGQERRGAHTDFGFMTLLYQDDAPGGLQVEVAPGSWTNVPHIPGALIVNVADLLSHWTNGRWKSSMHRVANPSRELSSRERISLPFFVNPNDDAEIAVIPGCEDGSETAAVRAGEWVSRKIAVSTSVMG